MRLFLQRLEQHCAYGTNHALTNEDKTIAFQDFKQQDN